MCIRDSNHALHAILNLVVQESVVAVEVELAAARGSGTGEKMASGTALERERGVVDGGPSYRAPKAEAGARAGAKVAKVASWGHADAVEGREGALTLEGKAS